VEEVMGVIGDFQNAWGPNLYMGMRPQNYGRPEGWSRTDEGKDMVKSMRTKFVKDELPMYLGRLEALLEKSGGDKWLVPGTTEPTIADCTAVSLLRSFTKGHIDHVDTKCLEVNPKVVAYVKRFCDLPQIKGRYENGLGSAAY
jgi:glutathione S-transferase